MSLPRMTWTDGDRTTTIEDCRLDGVTDRAPIGTVASIEIIDNEQTGDHERSQKRVMGYMTRDELVAVHAWAGAMLKQRGVRGYAS